MNKSKITGMLLGVGIGDALGMPVECMTAADILSKYPETNGRVTSYLKPTGHKWFNEQPAGSWTDDMQLTIATMKAIIEDIENVNVEYGETEGQLTLGSQINWHLIEYDKSTKGWGRTTRTAIENLKRGVSPDKSGLFGQGMGCGNGVAMKVAPLAAYIYSQKFKLSPGKFFNLYENFRRLLVNIAAMTHRTEMGIHSGFSQCSALNYCLNKNEEEFDDMEFVDVIQNSGQFTPSHITIMVSQDKLFDQFEILKNYKEINEKKAHELFGGGSCYAFHSLPMTYYYFLKNYKTIDSLYDLVSIGGDADSNGSMLASLLGALHGEEIFPKELIDGLEHSSAIQNLISEFVNTLDESNHA